MQQHWRRQAQACLLPLAAVLLLFLAVPLVMMIRQSFGDQNGNGFSLANFVQILSQPFYYDAFRNSFFISLYSALAGLIIALFVAAALAQTTEKTQEKMMLFINMTANFAGVPLAFAYIILLGNAGLVTLLLQHMGISLQHLFNLYSWQGLALTYVYFQVPLGVLFMYPVFKGMDRRWSEAAALLGASRFSFWVRIGLPHILPSVLGTFIILFANGMGTYETAYALVGGSVSLVTTRIASSVSGDIFAQPQIGSAMAVLFSLLMIAVLLVNQYLLHLFRGDLK
ncbi:MAG: transporter permease [Sporolactobacillus laevolacticus]|nr:transporter permease [Sporolactobacillus laevolacticus]